MFARRDRCALLLHAVWLSGLKTAAIVVAIGTSCIPSVVAASASAHAINASEFAIRADIRPFTNPSATSVSLRDSGSLAVIEYIAPRLLVTSAHERTLSPDQMKHIRSVVKNPALQDALRVKNFAGKGLSSGDQFRLLVNQQGRAPGEAFGFVDDAPLVVRSLLEELHRFAKTPDAAPKIGLDYGYVRSELITQEREKSLRDAGKVRFVSFSDFPSSLQPVLSRVIENPIEFHPVQQAQFEQLLERRSYGAEVFVVAKDGRFASQLVLYTTR